MLPTPKEYIRQVRATEDPRVVMPGAIYGLGMRNWGRGASLMCMQPRSAERTRRDRSHGARGLVLYLDTPKTGEVCGDAGLPYKDQAGLTARMREAIAMSEMERDRFRGRAIQRVRENYDWDAVTTQYETLLLGLRR